MKQLCDGKGATINRTIANHVLREFVYDDGDVVKCLQEGYEERKRCDGAF